MRDPCRHQEATAEIRQKPIVREAGTERRNGIVRQAPFCGRGDLSPNSTRHSGPAFASSSTTMRAAVTNGNEEREAHYLIFRRRGRAAAPLFHRDGHRWSGDRG